MKRARIKLKPLTPVGMHAIDGSTPYPVDLLYEMEATPRPETISPQNWQYLLDSMRRLDILRSAAKTPRDIERAGSKAFGLCGKRGAPSWGGATKGYVKHTVDMLLANGWKKPAREDDLDSTVFAEAATRINAAVKDYLSQHWLHRQFNERNSVELML